MKVGNINIALIGNPNVGKTSVFNQLTGLNQQVGNYPGITVEKKIGVCKLASNLKATILDLPGTYSLNASSLDENVVIELLLNKNDKDYPDVAIVVTDVENLKRNLLLFTQIKDLEIPTILVVNMADRMSYKGISLDIPYLEKTLKTKIALVSSRKGEGIETLKDLIINYKNVSTEPCLNASEIDLEYFNDLQKAFPNQLLYKLWLVITQDINFVNLDRKELPDPSFTKSKDQLKRLQHKETIKRYQFINQTLKIGQKIDRNQARDLRSRLDRILLHKVWGYFIFFFILMLIFQSIFDWASIPMDFIDHTFTSLASWVASRMPAGVLTDLITQGIIPGIGGIIIFIPQIAFLFMFISILEESGYMSRVVFIMDKLMRRFGLSGKSVVPLISGTACAIPAIMATRNIENWKERLISILVTPFTTCSARLPVYAIIISIIVPNQRILYIFNMQGFALMTMYLIGFLMALISAWVLHKSLHIPSNSYFVIEMPNYKLPMFKNVAINVIEKTKSFVLGAGKIILALSIILWFLASYGPGEDFKNAEKIITEQSQSTEDLEDQIASYKLENSYIGKIGKGIEPIIKPLGYDWKIGIAIISSFAAREVFVGTLATIYSIEDSEDQEATVKNRLAEEINPNTGEKLFNTATGVSLLLFYAFAMQCISTLAITKKETNGWKWPAIQLVFMSGFAYLVAFIAYQVLS
ncbi:ferrous iron transport protein B [Flavobacterium columnare]|uniref:Ferrous iron transport protein B n=2 Tax=Flavobacterium columnare TaxID=996 RepID=G8XAK9_FLACA|nr:ferrous iron transport protein B [Flavobacterium columnare]AEW86680.1 ferrous iron transport protein B [Flavobacterium columnare ATCC 49512]AMO20567.1 ferrous iron transport protein B [Flavobacterium columnare]AUX18540.1 iron transporter FeoB [Flavobacterium columnare]MEB3801535.1 ferrous iron transport protein B [Flavobacterium columnare]QOG57626.1 ferrous iron transport protein B [Flavobacterium columnare]